MDGKRLMLVLAACAVAGGARAADKPTGDAVLTVMQKVADWQLANPSPKPPTCWEKGALYAGLMALGDLVPSPAYRQAMLEVGRTNEWKPGARIYHADDYAVGQMYCEMYQLYREPAMLAPLRASLDHILAHPDTNPIGGAVSAGKDKAKAMRWWWCDALFMGPPAFARLAAATGEKKYLDYMVQEWKATTDYLFDKEEHLFFRDNTYFKKQEKNGKKVFWSRGNGWVLGGLVRVLQVLPADHPDRKFFEAQFCEMAEKILAIQPADGVWRASLLNPEAYALAEASGSSFFCYSLTWGINQGLLDRARFEPAVLKAWQGLCGFVEADGKLTHVQQVGAAPDAFTADHTDTYGVGAFLLAGSEIYRLVFDKPGVTVQVTSALDEARPQQTIEVDLQDLAAKLPDAKPENVAVMDASAGRWILSQVLEGKLLFQADFLPQQTKCFRLVAGVDRAQLPAPAVRTFGRYVPERADDFAWESDRIAFRMYGPALQQQDGDKTGSGVDVWCKHIRQPVINSMYKRDKKHNYHTDDGTAADNYRVGPNRGCGGAALWVDGKLSAARCYKSWKLIAEGPIRIVFELTYAPWDAGGHQVSEVRRISLDLGSNLNRFECHFDTGHQPYTAAAGLFIHSDASKVTHEANWVGMWEKFSEGDGPGFIPVGLVWPATSGGQFKQAEGHSLVLTALKGDEPFVYYAGAGWSKNPDFPDEATWIAYLKSFAARLASPLKVEVK
jgi:rhamnogalacturonyl hydrolase YesR